jgi:hypothetical protein
MRVLLKPFVVLALASVMCASSFALDNPLSDQAVREAYFLGQRHDEKMAEFLEKYCVRFPTPESGPWISSVVLLTPYAEVVDLSRQRSMGYSAQDAAQEYRKHGSIIRVTVTISFTASYGYLIEQNQPGKPAHGFALRSPDFWKDFSYRLFQGDDPVEPIDVQGNPVYSSSGDGASVLTGATIVLTYDVDKITNPSDTAVVIDIPDGRQVVAPFDLDHLR